MYPNLHGFQIKIIHMKYSDKTMKVISIIILISCDMVAV
jgi:hypothetical protein